MNRSDIVECLRRIRSKYRSVFALTDEMSRSSDARAMAEAVAGRQSLLCEIERVQKGLEGLGEKWIEQMPDASPAAALVADIRGLIRAVAAMDERVVENMRERMGRVSAELGALSRNSRAALSYASHAAGGYRMRRAG